MRRARIVCTIGPASQDRAVFRAMIKAGMDVARLNFSHGSCESLEGVVAMIREEAVRAGKSIAILSDLRGVKFRLGEMPGGGIQLKEKQSVEVCAGTCPSEHGRLYVSYPRLVDDVLPGECLFIDDGTIKLKVTGKKKDALQTVVIEGGFLKSRKGVNLPYTQTSMDTFTEKDRADLAYAARIGIDYIATSFVRTADDIQAILNWAKKKKITLPPIIAKIERPQAVQNIDAILQLVEGIMVARGDLGVESLPEEVPVFQKMLIERANQQGKLVITATQMMESMISHTRPTRAEASDVANAVLDGSDALMLAAETAAGKYPVETVKMMDRIIGYTETHLPHRIESQYFISGLRTPEAMADGACKAAQDINARAIIAFTHSGLTAKLISKLRPLEPVIAYTPDEKTYRKMALYWGITPQLLSANDTEDIDDAFVRKVEKYLQKEKLAGKGDKIILVASSSFFGKRNIIRLHKIE